LLKNYFKIAWRSLLKNKSSSFINIGSLSIGIAVSLLISLWIWDELSFNTYHKNYNRIVEVVQKQKFLGNIKVWDKMPYPLLDEIKNNYRHSFKHVAAALPSDDGYSLAVNEKIISKPGMFIGFEAPAMFTLKMLKGSWSALNDPHSIILSASSAKTLFGEQDPTGKQVQLINNWDPASVIDLKVTGVYEDLPNNTRLHEIEYFLPWDLFVTNNPWIKEKGWDDHRILIYAELNKPDEMAVVGSNIKNSELNIIKKLENMRAELAAHPEILLNPMNRWHLYSDFKDGVANRGPIQFVWLIGIIGGFVLFLACINFMNLSTARSEKRALEVGIRKTIGSMRGQLIWQFFSESYLVVLLAFVCAIIWVSFSLPVYNEMTAKKMVIPLTHPWFWFASLLFILFTGLLAGSYPALYLSSFQPVKALKGTFKPGRFASIPRKILVVFQFSVSIALIISTEIVYNQLIYAKNRPVGYTRDGLLMIPMKSSAYEGKYDILRNELKTSGAIVEMAESESAVTDVSSHNGGFTWKGKEPGIDENFGTLTVTHEYGQTIGWQFLEGRDFSNLYNDSSTFVVNEAAAKYMGLQHPIGETIRWNSRWNGFDKDFQIIGVIKDMVMQSPYEQVKPTIFRLGGNANWIYIRINPLISMSDALSKIEAVFKRIIPSVPFEYTFADDEFAKKFTSEVRIGRMAGIFSALAIFISCLGLYGMASFVAEQRIREIGVRKVLGASVFNLWRLISRDFVLLVSLSILIATPVAYYFMHRWLQNYQYRTTLSIWIFIVAGLGALIITLCTVSLQAIKAAITNPIQSLRTQ
jgi:ABC-type antimicrobial peptide transport system permease subunit